MFGHNSGLRVGGSGSGWSFNLAVQGRLADVLEDERQAAARGYTRGIKAATERLKQALRNDVVEAGLGTRLGNTWRSRTYPTAGASLGAAGFVWSKAPGIIEGQQGALIRGHDGFYLAIPTAAAPKMVLGKRVTPSALESAWGIKLRMIPGGGRNGRSGRPSLLVADLRAKRGQRGGFAAPNPNAKRKQKLTTVVLFVLLPQVRLKRRLDVDARYTQIAGELGLIVAGAMDEELANVDPD